MFWSNPIADLKITIFLLIVAIMAAIVVYIVKKKFFISLFIFSVLANLIIYLTFLTGTRMFNFYDINWLKSFAINSWPFINIALFLLLIIGYFKNEENKNN